MLPYPPRGGALQRSYHLLVRAARAHDVHLVAINNRALLPSGAAVDQAVTELARACRSVHVFDNRFSQSRARWALLVAQGFWRPTPYDVDWLGQADLRGFLGQLARSAGFDLLHVDTLGLMPYTEYFPGVPIVLNHHNIESQMMRRRSANERRLLNRLYFRRDAEKLERCERIFCCRATMNVTVSLLDAERLREIAPSADTVVVENGVDIEYFKPREPHGGRSSGLIFVGTMNWYPNQEAIRYFLTEIWPRLTAEEPERRLTVIGRDPPASLLTAARSGNVFAPGFVDDVRPYLADAAIYVCPIRDGGGTRLKVLDAAAMAKPIVATRLAVEGLDFVEGEHYLAAETPDEYVAQIRRLERDLSLRDRLGRASRRLVEERYSWDIVARKLCEAYEQARVKASPRAEPFVGAARGEG